MLHSTQRRKRLNRKFKPKWIGPFQVVSRLSDVIYRTQESERSKPNVVHFNPLKEYSVAIPVELNWIPQKQDKEGPVNVAIQTDKTETNNNIILYLQHDIKKRAIANRPFRTWVAQKKTKSHGKKDKVHRKTFGVQDILQNSGRNVRRLSKCCNKRCAERRFKTVTGTIKQSIAERPQELRRSERLR